MNWRGTGHGERGGQMAPRRKVQKKNEAGRECGGEWRRLAKRLGNEAGRERSSTLLLPEIPDSR